MVNFYRDMWRHRSHILAPLTKLTLNKAVFEWTDEQQEACAKRQCYRSRTSQKNSMSILMQATTN
jgi:hypothetical protein